MTLDELGGVAVRSPKAFYSIIGEKPAPKANQSIKGSVNTETGSFNTSGERNFDFYQNIRRTNRKLYFSPETQRQMFADKKRLGDKF